MQQKYGVTHTICFSLWFPTPENKRLTHTPVFARREWRLISSLAPFDTRGESETEAQLPCLSPLLALCFWVRVESQLTDGLSQHYPGKLIKTPPGYSKQGKKISNLFLRTLNIILSKCVSVISGAFACFLARNNGFCFSFCSFYKPVFVDYSRLETPTAPYLRQNGSSKVTQGNYHLPVLYLLETYYVFQL
jgi:hypothetical protein